MYIGVDTHKRAHVLVAIDDQGQPGGTHTMANTPSGWAAALSWAHDRDAVCIWGIENSGSLGKGFAQFLLIQGESDVHEIVPHRTAQYRKRGRSQDKTDAADALAMARLLRAETAFLPTVPRDDVSTELRLMSDHRDNLVAERTRLINQLHAQMLQIDPCYEEKSGALTSLAGVRSCRDLAVPHAEGVVRMCGVGTIIAARLIGELGCVPRVHSAAALAALAGIAPVAVSSGGKHGYRLNRGGNRRLNKAFHMIALSQLRCEPLARAYYAKKRAEGKTARAALRCLKRRLVDVVYRLGCKGNAERVDSVAAHRADLAPCRSAA